MPKITANGKVDSTDKKGNLIKGTMDGSECSVYASNYRYDKYYWYESFNLTYGSAANTAILNLKKDLAGKALTTPDEYGYLIFYSPTKLKINSILFENPTNGNINYRPAEIIIYGANSDCYVAPSGSYIKTTFDDSKFIELAKTTTQPTNTHRMSYTIDILETKYENITGFQYFIIKAKPIKTKATGQSHDLLAFPEIKLFGEQYVDTNTKPITPVRVISIDEYHEEINNYGFCGAFALISTSDVEVDEEGNEIEIINNELVLPNLKGVFLTRCKFTKYW